MKALSKLHGKRILITGGSSGIGKATAERCVQAGAHVAIVARNVERLQRALDNLRAQRAHQGQRIEALSIDQSQQQEVLDKTSQALELLGGLDILINNAGVSHAAYIDAEKLDVYEQVMRTNYLGAVWMTHACLPALRQQRSGHIAFVSSIAGLMGVFGYGAYAASKFALVGFAESLRQDLLAYDIGVSVLFPPDTYTPQLEAEHGVRPSETAAISGNIKPLEASTVADALLRGIANKRFAIVPGFMASGTVWAARHLPGVARWVMDRDLQTYWKKHGHRVS